MKTSPKDLKRIGIIGGCGHVGLPFGIALAMQSNTQVTLVDTNQKAVALVNEGKMPFDEKGGDEALAKVAGKTLKATTTANAIAQCDVVVVVTGTPVDEHLNPRISDVLAVIDHYTPQLNRNQLVVMRSTLAPGTTKLIAKHLSEKVPGIRLAFCPERVAQGNALSEIVHLPQIISAFDSASEQMAVEFFNLLGSEILLLTPEEAELVKLFANSWRYIQFAVANQHYMIAEAAGIDFRRIYNALTHNYPRLKNLDRPGLTAGPCLFKDTMQLSAFYNNNFFLGHAAMLVNEGMPNFLVQQLEKEMGSLEGKKIGLLGMAFKANCDDTRDSLSYKVKKLLKAKMAIVLDTDVYQPSHKNLSRILLEAEGFILGVPHREYLSLNVGNKPFLDCWGVWGKPKDISLSPFESLLKKAS